MPLLPALTGSFSKAADIADLVNSATSCTCSAIGWREDLAVPESATLVVNATSLGSPISIQIVRSWEVLWTRRSPIGRTRST
jgi:hypothetical protein